jgi:two-component system CheB/CheR fusion protein
MALRFQNLSCQSSLGVHGIYMESHGPPSLIIDQSHTILHVSDTAGRFLMHPKGPLTGDVLKLVRPEIQLELRAAIFQAFEKDRSVVSNPVFVQFNGHPRRVVVAVRPRIELKGPGRSLEKHALILFLENELDEAMEAADAASNRVGDHPKLNELVVQLQSENQRLREQLQVTTEEYESSNEEMRASNEELQSINEEYRSATKELETSKEELQSVNEELQTVNNDLKLKLQEIAAAHQELEISWAPPKLERSSSTASCASNDLPPASMRSSTSCLPTEVAPSVI